MTLTLKQFHDRCKELSDQGYEVWIEGQGDGRWKLVIEGLQITEENRKHIRVGDTNGRTNRSNA